MFPLNFITNFIIPLSPNSVGETECNIVLGKTHIKEFGTVLMYFKLFFYNFTYYSCVSGSSYGSNYSYVIASGSGSAH